MHINGLRLVFSLHYLLSSRLQESHMTIRIEKETDRLKTMIRVSGRLQSRHLDELKTQLAGARSRIVLDLSGVALVDVEIVRFLNA
jgi:anti-anti-sigma regulatory factor